MSAVFIYVTTPDSAEAKRIGRVVVEEGLAACANILPEMQSIYRWQGVVEEAKESVLLFKTTEAKVAELTCRVIELHPYDCPCVAALPITTGNPEYLAWIERLGFEPSPDKAV